MMQLSSKLSRRVGGSLRPYILRALSSSSAGATAAADNDSPHSLSQAIAELPRDSSRSGTAAELLSVIQSHRSEWEASAAVARKKASRQKRKQERARRLAEAGKASPADYRVPKKRSDSTMRPRPLKAASALGLTGDRPSREITNRVVAAYSNTEAQLNSKETSYEDKIAAARRCILSFRRLSSLPLSDINISAIMHRVCRLVSHEALKNPGRVHPLEAYPDLGQDELMKSLLKEVVDRIRVQLEAAEVSSAAAAEASGSRNGYAPAAPPLQIQATTRTGEYSISVGEVHESTAALALYSCGSIGIEILNEDLDLICRLLLNTRNEWSDGRTVIIALSLGKLGAMPLDGAMHKALHEEVEKRLPRFAPDELSTLLWGLAHAYYNPGPELVTRIMASLEGRVHKLPRVGVYSTLDALSLLEWIPPFPEKAMEAPELDPWRNLSEFISTEKTVEGFDGKESGILAALSRQEEDKRGGDGGGGRSAEQESARQNQMRDLRELQSVAREWEMERRRGLAALMQQQQLGGTTSGGGVSRGAAVDAVLGGGAGGGFRLDALARQALRARAERDSVAMLRQEATRIARQLRAAAAEKKRKEEEAAGEEAKRREAVGGGGSERLEDDEVLVARFLTGEWPEMQPTERAENTFDLTSTVTETLSAPPPLSPLLTPTAGVSTSIRNSATVLEAKRKLEARITGSSTPLSSSLPSAAASASLDRKATAANAVPSYTPQAFSSLEQINAARKKSSPPPSSSRILRLGPLTAEASYHPSSGSLVIEPHYDVEHLFSVNLFDAQHAQHEQELDLESQLEHHTSDDSHIADLASGASRAGDAAPLASDPGMDTLEALDSLEELSAQGELASLEDFIEAAHSEATVGATVLPSGEKEGEIEDELSHREKQILKSVSSEEKAPVMAPKYVSPRAQLRFSAAAAFHDLVERASEILSTARPDQVVQLSRWLGCLRHLDRDFLTKVRDQIEDSLDKGAPQPHRVLNSINLADFLWVYASLGATDLLSRDLTHKVMQAALADPGASPIALARCIWSLAVFGHLDSSMLRLTCDKIESTKDGRIGTGDGSEYRGINPHSYQIMLKQLFQAALQVEISTGEPHETLLPDGLRDPAAAAWLDRRNFLFTSTLQREVASTLSSLGLTCELEHTPPGSPVVIDIAVFDPETGGKVAVEVDGPSHYATNIPYHALGAVKLRDSLMRHSGWEVVSVPYYEWVRVKPWEHAKYAKAKVMPALERSAGGR